jgi:hypothetical protein
MAAQPDQYEADKLSVGLINGVKDADVGLCQVER